MRTTKTTRNRNNKRVTVIVMWALLTMLLCSSCSLGILGRSIDEDSLIEKKFEKILGAIEQKDKDELESLFSKKALSKAENLDNNMDYIFDILQGKVKLWDYNSANVSEDNRYGDKAKKAKAWFNIETDKGKYVMFFIDYMVDDFDSDNIGLYTLALMTKEDWDGVESFEEVTVPGVYKPDNE